MLIRNLKRIALPALLGGIFFTTPGLAHDELSESQKQHLLYTLDGAATLVAFDLGAGKILRSVTLPAAACPDTAEYFQQNYEGSVALDPQRELVYAADAASGTVVQLNARTLAVKRTMNLGWNTCTTGIKVQAFEGVALTPDGRRLAVANLHGGVSIFKTPELTYMGEVPNGTTFPCGVSFCSPYFVAISTRGLGAAAARNGNGILLFDPYSENNFRLIAQADGLFGQAVFVNNGRTILTERSIGEIRAYSVRNGELLYAIGNEKSPFTDSPLRLSVSPDGRRFLVYGYETLQIFDSETGTRYAQRDFTELWTAEAGQYFNHFCGFVEKQVRCVSSEGDRLWIGDATNLETIELIQTQQRFPAWFENRAVPTLHVFVESARQGATNNRKRGHR